MLESFEFQNAPLKNAYRLLLLAGPLVCFTMEVSA